MQTSLSQMIDLVLRGNAKLEGFTLPDISDDSENFQFCEQVTFSKPVAGGRPSKSEVLFENPQQWLSNFAVPGVKGFELQFCSRSELSTKPQAEAGVAARQTNGFVGGGVYWVIATKFEKPLHLNWCPNWVLWDKLAADRRIWRVDYTSVGHPFPFRPTSFQKAFEELGHALSEIEAYAEDEALNPWTGIFRDARELLHGNIDTHKVGFIDNIPNEVLGKDAKFLLLAAHRASVFGAMGSWNDLLPKDAGRYSLVSDRLFDALNIAIAAAVNKSSAASVPSKQPQGKGFLRRLFYKN